MRHNFWKERTLVRQQRFGYTQISTCKQYDFNLYKGFFMEKNGPNSPIFYDKF
jgi:hypothetical protein